MKTKDDTYTATDMIEYQSGVNTGYSLELSHENHILLETVQSIVNRNKEHPFCRGLRNGVEKAKLDRKQDKHLQRGQRLDELSMAQHKNRDHQDLDR